MAMNLSFKMFAAYVYMLHGRFPFQAKHHGGSETALNYHAHKC